MAVKRSGEDIFRKWSLWKKALQSQSRPAIISVFSLSDSPPSQRFGLEIVYGAAIAVLVALFIFPALFLKEILHS